MTFGIASAPLPLASNVVDVQPPLAKSILKSKVTGYGVAVLVPVVATLVARLGTPAFVFEHLIVLLTVMVALVWSIGPAVTTALVATFTDNVLLSEPIGRPAITGARDVFDLVLFVTVAVTVAWLVARARREKNVAEAAVEHERQMREERDRLVASVAHDLANPLGVIQGTLQTARHSVAAANDIGLSRALTRVERAASRATSIVRNLADMHAVDCENLEMALEVVDLREVTAPVIQMFDGISVGHPISLETPAEPLILRADVDRLQRVIENLIANAIKYSPKGGNVRVSIVADGDHAVLNVRDEGIGISACALQHVFERGYRAPEAKAVAPGLGLGLSTSAAILKRHGGVIQVSRAEKGSIVSVRLPLVSVASRSAARCKSQPKARHSSEHAAEHST